MSSAASPPAMQYRRLGNSGLKVTELCLGAMTFSISGKGAWGMPAANEAESIAMLDRFVAAGGNFIDTANVYGESEEVIGRWLASKPAEFRSQIIIATKFRGDVGKGPNDQGASRKHIMDAVEKSLKSLKTSYVDLYQQHVWDENVPLRETLHALTDLVRAGKVRYIGVSNFTSWQIAAAMEIVRKENLEPIVTLQPQYSLLCRNIEWDIIGLCKRESIGLLPWSPLAGGWLSGKYKRDQNKPVDGGRVAWAEAVKWKETDWSTKSQEQTYQVIDELEAIAKELKTSVSAVALRWLMQREGVTSVIIGAKNLEQLNGNLEATKIVLSEEQMKRLTKVSDTPEPYPYSMIKMRQ